MRLRSGVHKYKAYFQAGAQYIRLFRAVNDFAPKLGYLSHITVFPPEISRPSLFRSRHKCLKNQDSDGTIYATFTEGYPSSTSRGDLIHGLALPAAPACRYPATFLRKDCRSVILDRLRRASEGPMRNARRLVR